MTREWCCRLKTEFLASGKAFGILQRSFASFVGQKNVFFPLDNEPGWREMNFWDFLYIETRRTLSEYVRVLGDNGSRARDILDVRHQICSFFFRCFLFHRLTHCCTESKALAGVLYVIREYSVNLWERRDQMCYRYVYFFAHVDTSTDI